MRFVLEIVYDEDDGEDVGAVGRTFADICSEQDGVQTVTVYGEETSVVPHPAHPPIVIEKGDQ